MTIITYKGCEALARYDANAKIFHGEVMNLRDVITFQAHSPTKLQQALAASVEDYIVFCKERDEEPEKPCDKLSPLA